MLKVRVIRKYKDPKTELLVGYTIQDMNTGNTMNVYKDQLKQAIKAGQVDCINMTMTSDGRLIGKAYKEPVRPRTNTAAQPVVPQAQAPAPVKPQEPVKPQTPAVEAHHVAPAVEAPAKSAKQSVAEVYTNGKNIAAVLVNGAEDKFTIPGYAEGQTFDFNEEAVKKIKDGWYANVTVEDGKPKFEDSVKRKSFKSVKNKMLKALVELNYKPELVVEKTATKGEYDIILTNEAPAVAVEQLVWALVADSMITDKIHFNYADEHKFNVSTTRIDEARKTVKNAFVSIKSDKPAEKKKAEKK